MKEIDSMLRRSLLLATFSLAACSPPQQFVSHAQAGQVAFSFDNDTGTTNFVSNSHSLQAGIAGTILDLSSQADGKFIDQITVDGDGNLGVRGDIYSVVGDKPRPGAQEADPLEYLRDAHLAVYPEKDKRRFGIGMKGSIPVGLSSKDGTALDQSRSLLLAMAAINALSAKVDRLEAQLAQKK